MRCETCRYFVQEVWGTPPHCRLLPPKAPSDTRAYFPVVRPQWFCGQHSFSLRAWLRATWRRWKSAWTKAPA